MKEPICHLHLLWRQLLWHVKKQIVAISKRNFAQVGPQKSTSYKNHLSGKFPRLLTLPRESRPRFSKGGMFSKEVDEAVGELRRWRVRNGNFDEVIEKYGKKFSSRDISCLLKELQRRRDWQCTLEVSFLFFLIRFLSYNGIRIERSLFWFYIFSGISLCK